MLDACNQPMFGFFSMPSGWEMLVILFVALLLFGRRLPEVARSMGKSIVEFKRGMNDVRNQIDTDVHSEETPTDPHALTDKTLEHDKTKS